MGETQGGNRIRGRDTNPTRPSARRCSGVCRWPRRRAGALVAGEPGPRTWRPNGPRPTSWCCPSCASGSAWSRCGGRSRVRRRSRRRRWPFSSASVSRSGIWGMSELSCIATVSHPRDTRLGSVGKLLPGYGLHDRRGRRIPGARTIGDEGLPQGAGEDRGGDRRRRLAAHRRHPRCGLRRLPAGGRPEERDDHQCGRKEHVADQHREHDQGRVPAGRRHGRHRRRATVQHRADRPRRRVGRPVRRAAGGSPTPRPRRWRPTRR